MKTLPGIRHIRWLYHTARYAIWWERQGRFIGAFPNPADAAFLDAVRDGRA